MANRQNCWDFKKCGREPGGSRVIQLGVCTAAITQAANGMNGGKNGGRICWAVAGTLCGGKVQGSFAQKRVTCENCDFYAKVKEEEGGAFRSLMPGQN